MVEVLKITGLTAGYGPLRVLHEIDFKVAEGERVGLVGLNGHGKTTLFRAISSLVGWQSGSILLNGVEVGGWNVPRMVRVENGQWKLAP